MANGEVEGVHKKELFDIIHRVVSSRSSGVYETLEALEEAVRASEYEMRTTYKRPRTAANWAKALKLISGILPKVEDLTKQPLPHEEQF